MLLIELIPEVYKKLVSNEKIFYVLSALVLVLFGTIFIFSKYNDSYKFSFGNRNNLAVKKDDKPTLFCFILTIPDNYYNKTTSVYRTWATKCDDFRFISVIPKLYLNEQTKYFKHDNQVSVEVDRPFPILQPAGHEKEIYKRLTDKIYLTLIDLYRRYNKYDWFLKADDDTYIFVDHLREFIANKNSSVAYKFGYNLKTWQSGGAGYLLSNKSLNEIGSKLSSDYKFCQNKGIEDKDIAVCFHKLGIQPSQSIDEQGRERFHP
jgi:glycoprotein-N-acetylgalactosamine 3-beta-galactosyltransferase